MHYNVFISNFYSA